MSNYCQITTVASHYSVNTVDGRGRTYRRDHEGRTLKGNDEDGGQNLQQITKRRK